MVHNSDSDRPAAKHDKIALRRERNALAAARSRERKRVYTENLNDRIKMLTAEKEAFQQQLKAVMEILKDREAQVAQLSNGAVPPKEVPLMDLPEPRAWTPMENPFNATQVSPSSTRDNQPMEMDSSSDEEPQPKPQPKIDPEVQRQHQEKLRKLLEMYKSPVEALGLQGWDQAKQQFANQDQDEQPDFQAAYEYMLDVSQQIQSRMEKEVATLKILLQDTEAKVQHYKQQLEKERLEHKKAMEKELEKHGLERESLRKSVEEVRSYYNSQQKLDKPAPIPAYSPAQTIVPLPPNLNSLPQHVLVRLLQQTHLHLSTAMDDVEFLRKQVVGLRTGHNAEETIKHGSNGLTLPEI